MSHNYEPDTRIFKTVGTLELTLDVISHAVVEPTEENVAVIHFHGGFLVVGEKQTFPPHWLIGACRTRGWHYVTPNYRLLPEAKGDDVIQDALDAVQWVFQNLTKRIIIAGSSAGGLLALAATAAQLQDIRPLAVVSIYGMMDLSNDRYVRSGTTLMGAPPMSDLKEILQNLYSASSKGQAVIEYPFPEDESDLRMKWIAALHEAALFPDLLCGIHGLSNRIRTEGVQGIPVESRKFFPLQFGLGQGFPPAAFLHGDQDSCVDVEQSIQASEALQNAGIRTCLEIVQGKDHGFDAMEVAPGTDIDVENNGSALVLHLKTIIQFLDEVVGETKRL